MSSINIKAFNTLIEKLEKLADGINGHSGDESFPVAVKEEEVRTMRNDIETVRQEYDAAENAARIKHDEYTAKMKNVEADYTRYTTMIYGFYGKKNQVLADFGLAPHKTTGRRGPRIDNKVPAV